MRYQVPQFIEIEDKIFGPFTLKQFIYIVGGGGICYTLYKFLPLPVALILMLPVGAFSGALAFYRVNPKKPFLESVDDIIKYALGKKLYVWEKKQITNSQTQMGAVNSNEQPVFVPKLNDSKLRDLTWSLDINESISSRNNTRKSFRQGEEDHVSDSFTI